MKKLLVILIAFSPLFLGAQSYVTVVSSEYVGFEPDAVPAFKAEVQRVSRIAFMDSWNKYLADQSNVKVVMRTDYDIIVEHVIMKAIISTPVNVYMHFEDMENGTRVYVAFEDTVTGFISPEDPKYGVSLNKLVKDRSLSVFYEAKKDDLAGEEKELKSLEKEYNAIVKQEDKINKEILSKTREIEKEKNEIKINNDVLAEVADELSAQRSKLNSMPASTPSEVRKATEKEIKKQEKKRDNLSKSIDKSSSKIFDTEKDIRDLQYEIDKLKHDENFAKEKVDNQRLLVLDLKNQVYELKK